MTPEAAALVAVLRTIALQAVGASWEGCPTQVREAALKTISALAVNAVSAGART
jgi:hypothetical protein